jgi:hypothetical protein
MEQLVAAGAEIQETPTAAPAHTVQEHTVNTTASGEQRQETGASEMARTPLQRVQDALKRRFGREILRTSTSRPRTAACSGGDQRGEEEAVVLLQNNALVQRRAGKEPITTRQHAQEEGRFYAPATGDTRLRTTPATRCGRSSNLNPRREGGSSSDVRRTEQRRTETAANTPWGQWTAAGGPAKDNVTTQTSITAVMEESRRARLDRQIRQRDHTDFGRKAWIQSDKSSSAWVTTCPKEHSRLTEKQFPVVAQAYFGVGQRCLVGLVGRQIRQKAGRGKEVRDT